MEPPDEPTAWPVLELSPDGRRLLVSVNLGWGRTDIHLLDRATGEWRTVIAGEEVVTTLTFAADGMTLVGVTTLEAPHGRIVEVAVGEHTGSLGPDAWTTLVPEGDVVLGAVAVGAAELWVVETRQSRDTIGRYRPDGTRLGSVEGLGGAVAVAEGGITTDPATGAAFVVVDAFDAPTTLWQLPRGSGPAVPWAPVGEEAPVPCSWSRSPTHRPTGPRSASSCYVAPM